MKGQICKFRKWNESKMADVNWSEDDAVLGLFADNSYEEADFMGFLPQDMNAVLSKVPLSDFKHDLPSDISISRQGGPVIRATDKARKSVITHWKLVKTHWKNKQGVKIRISISRYALGVKSSAYRLAKVKLWIDDVHLSVFLSTYYQQFPLRYDKWYLKKQMFAIWYHKH